MTFPLPLTAFEYYYWCDDRPDYPTAFPVDMRFTGKLDRRALEAALPETLARHPLLHAQIDASHQRPAWVASQAEIAIDWADASVPIRDPRGPRMDLAVEPGLRVWVREGIDTTRLRVQIHHACCDGLAGISFSEELLVDYCRKLGTIEAPPPSVDVEQLATRDQFLDDATTPRGGLLAGLRDAAITIRQFSKLLIQRPAVLAPPQNLSTVDEAEDLDYSTAVVDAETTKILRDVARQQQSSLNDVLLRDMFVVAGQWNLARGHKPSEWLRFLMPVDLRTRRDRTMPAANRMSFSFLTRRAKAARDPQALLHDIRREVQQIRDQKLGLYFLGGLGIAAMTGVIPWALRRPQPFATLCLSNLGRLFGGTALKRRDGKVVCGDAVLESLIGVPPIRPHTHASLAIFLYAHELFITLRCDPKRFSTLDRDAFLSAFVAQLQATAGEKTGEHAAARTV